MTEKFSQVPLVPTDYLLKEERKKKKKATAKLIFSVIVNNF